MAVVRNSPELLLLLASLTSRTLPTLTIGARVLLVVVTVVVVVAIIVVIVIEKVSVRGKLDVDVDEA